MFFTIPNFLERMAADPLSPLTFLSISAIITTISLFFCGIPICLQIHRRRSTNEISGFPFLMGFLGGSFWLRYGFLKFDLTMITVNIVGVSMMALYMLFYLFYSRPRTNFLIQLSIVLSLVTSMLALVDVYKEEALNALGLVSMTFNILNFGAPLAGLSVVLRNRSCATLPLPLCIANLLVSSQWCLYGVCVHDIFIIIPNGTGVLLACAQISLFLVLPRKDGTHAPLAKCCPSLLDLEKGEVLRSESSRAGGGGGRHRWKKGGQKRSTAPYFHAQLPSKLLLHQHRVVDWRQMIPASRTACIEFLRGGGCSRRAFDSSNFGSVTSRSTADSWLNNNNSSSLSRVSSISHPDLYNSSELFNNEQKQFGCCQGQPGAAAAAYLIVEVLSNSEIQNHQHRPHRLFRGGGSSLLRSHTCKLSTAAQQPNSSSSNLFSSLAPNQQQQPTPQLLLDVASSSTAALSTSRPTFVFGGPDFGKASDDDRQLLAEERAGGGGGDFLLVRTLSAPDLLLLQQQQTPTTRS